MARTKDNTNFIRSFKYLLVDWFAEDDVAANLDRMLLSDICSLCATGGILANVAGNLETSDFISDSNSSNWLSTLCNTALAGLLPASDSLLRCWWDSARHSTSAKRAFNDMAGWLGSWVRLRYAARRSCSSITWKWNIVRRILNVKQYKI